jgi:hypothetical protein
LPGRNIHHIGPVRREQSSHFNRGVGLQSTRCPIYRADADREGF